MLAGLGILGWWLLGLGLPTGLGLAWGIAHPDSMRRWRAFHVCLWVSLVGWALMLPLLGGLTLLAAPISLGAGCAVGGLLGLASNQLQRLSGP